MGSPTRCAQRCQQVLAAQPGTPCSCACGGGCRAWRCQGFLLSGHHCSPVGLAGCSSCPAVHSAMPCMPCLPTLWVALLVAKSLRPSSVHVGGLAAAASGSSQVASSALMLACGSWPLLWLLTAPVAPPEVLLLQKTPCVHHARMLCCWSWQHQRHSSWLLM